MNEENERYLDSLKTQAAEKELEYWNLKVETAKIDKELREKMVKYFIENMGEILKMGFNLSTDLKIKEE